jgi:peroxiredoxin
MKRRARGIFLLVSFIMCYCHGRDSHDDKVDLPMSQGIGGMWEALGHRKGEKIPDFTLYTNEGRPFSLYKALQKGKPVVLINASYTCDFSRANIESFKTVGERYKDKVETVIVYTLDAHPTDVPSPYAADSSVWIPPHNVRDSIAAPQPKTYGERIDLSKKWVDMYDIPFPVLVDSPENEYWTEYGQAPNMCYIIGEDGIVEYRDTWYNEKRLEEELAGMDD